MSKAKKDTKIKYAVIQDTDLEQLVLAVNNLILDGYVPSGGISTAVSVRHQNQIIYTQSLTQTL